MEDLARALAPDVQSGLRLAEHILLPPTAEDFASYSEQMSRRACHGCCNRTVRECKIAMKCHQCMRSEMNVICARCFMHQDHSDHADQITLHQINGVCDCGDPNSLRPASYSNCHSGAPSNLLDLLSWDDVSRLGPVLATVAAFMTEKLPGPASLVCVQWLSTLREWGDGYQRAVIMAFGRKQIQKNATTSRSHDPAIVREHVEPFLLAMIDDVLLKKFIAEIICDWILWRELHIHHIHLT
jgi:hypothetical protein